MKWLEHISDYNVFSGPCLKNGPKVEVSVSYRRMSPSWRLAAEVPAKPMRLKASVAVNAKYELLSVETSMNRQARKLQSVKQASVILIRGTANARRQYHNAFVTSPGKNRRTRFENPLNTPVEGTIHLKGHSQNIYARRGSFFSFFNMSYKNPTIQNTIDHFLCKRQQAVPKSSTSQRTSGL